MFSSRFSLTGNPSFLETLLPAAVVPTFKASLPISAHVFREYTCSFFPFWLPPPLAAPVSIDLTSSFADEIAAEDILVDNGPLGLGSEPPHLIM